MPALSRWIRYGSVSVSLKLELVTLHSHLHRHCRWRHVFDSSDCSTTPDKLLTHQSRIHRQPAPSQHCHPGLVWCHEKHNIQTPSRMCGVTKMRVLRWYVKHDHNSWSFSLRHRCYSCLQVEFSKDHPKTDACYNLHMIKLCKICIVKIVNTLLGTFHYGGKRASYNSHSQHYEVTMNRSL